MTTPTPPPWDSPKVLMRKSAPKVLDMARKDTAPGVRGGGMGRSRTLGNEARMDLGLAGGVALVTGAYRGTGAGIAGVLAAEGATVLVHGWEQGQADHVAAGIVEAGGIAHSVSGDIRTDFGTDRLVDM